jgi:hypothetical protein
MELARCMAVLRRAHCSAVAGWLAGTGSDLVSQLRALYIPGYGTVQYLEYVGHIYSEPVPRTDSRRLCCDCVMK